MRYITATYIFSGQTCLPTNAVIAISNEGLIVDVISKEVLEANEIEHFEGIITPGFINAHCHLELSHLKNKINKHTGIVDFGLEVIKQRNHVPLQVQEELMLQADADMYQEGIVAVGDISNTTQSIAVKKQSKISYHTFVELIGLNPARAHEVFDKGREVLTKFILKDLACSFAPHAPYSVSPQLIHGIAALCLQTNQPTSIHNQESQAENDFFKNKTGNYLNLYNSLNLPLDFFEPTGLSSLQSVLPFFDKEVTTQLVHNSFTSKEDIAKAKGHLKNAVWCLCPQANLYIEQVMPPLNLLIEEQCKLTIGTDSLASNSQLSIIDEINVILKHFPTIPIEALLQAATINGAEFLNLQSTLGSIEKNKTPGLNLLKKAKRGIQ